MRQLWGKTLFSRMLVTYLGVIMCLLLFVSFTSTTMFRNQYISEEESALRREAEKINTILLEKYIYDEKRPVANEELLTVARQYDALVQIIDAQGSLRSFYDETADEQKWAALSEATDVYTSDSGEAIISMPGMTIWPATSAVLVGRGLKAWEEQPRDAQTPRSNGMLQRNIFRSLTGIPTLTVIRTVWNNEQIEGVVLMHIDTSAVQASIKRVYLEMLLTAIIAVLAAVLAVYYITTRITRPITEMNQTVQQYTKGEFNVRVTAEGGDEVAGLARSFNAMADELNDLEETRRSFVANVSHELRSPLTSMGGFLEAIQDGTIPPEEQSKYIDVVLSETRRMTAMVNDLLDLARIESGQIKQVNKRFDLNELALRTLITFEARITQKKLEVTLSLHEPNCYVQADDSQISQVIRNLIDNAIKFSYDGGKLEIGTRVVGKQKAELYVRDHGTGIPEADIAHVFERFYKVEKAHTPSTKSGTGLGLAIVKRIIDAHRQDIRVESTAGQGTCFTFTLKHVAEPVKRTRQKGGNPNDDGGNGK